MRKIQICLSALLLAIVLNINESHAQTFEKGTKLASLGIGLGNPYGLGFISPSIQGILDIGVSPKLGIGYIGIGGILAFSTGSIDYGGGYYNKYSVRYTNFSIGARATYHFDLDIEKLDLYGGVVAGYNIGSSSDNYSGGFGYTPDYKSYSRPIIGAFAGARYYFTSKFAVYGELGNEISFVSAGITLKF